MSQVPLPLASYRALDLTEDGALLCGRMLADLGADVVQIEPPKGNPTRHIGPFYQDENLPDRSLFWFAYSSNKRGVTLNLEAEEGKALFKKLIQSSHFFLESFSPGYLQGLGLDYQELKSINPGLIMVSITPFGQSGPFAQYKGPDLVTMALGGMMGLTGDPDRPPLQIGFPQALLGAAASGAVGAMIAHYSWITTSLGQHVDASAQQSVVRSLSHAPQIWYLNQQILQRQGTSRPQHGGHSERTVWPCKDGYISYTVSFLQASGQNMWALIAWMDEDKIDTDYLKSIDWEQLDRNQISQQTSEKIEQAIAPFFVNHSKAELWDGAVERRILLYPLSSPQDLLNNPQLKSRRYFQSIPHPDLGVNLTYPGPAVQITGAYHGIRRRSPLLGEHNEEIYTELGISSGQLLELKTHGIV